MSYGGFILIGVGASMVFLSTLRYILAKEKERKAKAARALIYSYMLGFMMIGLGLITFMPE